MFVAFIMNVSIVSLHRLSDPVEILSATVRMKVKLVASSGQNLYALLGTVPMRNTSSSSPPRVSQGQAG